MKQSNNTYQNNSSVKSFKNITDINYFNSKKEHSSQIVNLYAKHEDEPDFDCEFLESITNDNTESVIDMEYEDDYKDDYNDNQWEADLYDPYLESTYY